MPKSEKEKLRELLKTKELKNLDTILRKIKVKPIRKPLTPPEEEPPRLKTFTVLDDILGGGGIEAGKLIEVFGEYGAGKSQLAFTLAVEADGLVIFVDAEGTWSRLRVTQIAKARGKDLDTVNEKILLFQPEDWDEQFAIIRQLDTIVGDRKISLVVVDSLMALLDSSPDMMTERQHLPERARLVRMQLRYDLRRFARKHNCAVFFTNQVMANPNITPYTPMEKQILGRGGHSVRHIPDFVIMIRKAKGNVRIARLLDSSEIPLGERPFCINERGIDDLPEEYKEKAMKVAEKYNEKMASGQYGKKVRKKGEEVVEEETSEETET